MGNCSIARYTVIMRVGINAHLLSFSGTYRQAGLSRYIEEMLFQIPPKAPDLQFTGYIGNTKPGAQLAKRTPANLTLKRSLLPTQRASVRIAWEQSVLPIAAARNRLDLLHCPVNVMPFAAPCPTLVTVHDLIFLRWPANFHPAKRFYLAALTGWAAKHARHLIAVSEATRRDVIDLLHVPPRRVTTVHNGVGEQFGLADSAQKAAFRREQGIQGRVVLYVGTLEPRKNLPLLLKAFAQLAADPQFGDVTLYVGGSKGWYYDEIFTTAERLNLTQSSRVRFLGRVPDAELPMWYNIATVFAYPSVYEGFGLPALEAMSCGIPVITSDTSALPEVVGSAGLLLDPHDQAAWTAGLRDLLSDESRRVALGEQARRQAAQFSWQRCAQETLAVYRAYLSTPQERHSTGEQHREG